MNIIKSSVVYSSFTSLSRIFGYTRDILIATFLGTGVVADIFFVAFRLPNTFRRIFSEGALNQAFVPIYTKLLNKRSDEPSKIFAGNTLVIFFLLTFLIVIIIEIFMPSFLRLIAPGFIEDQLKFNELIYVSRIIFPFLILICISSLYSAILNANNNFAISAALPILLNSTLIISMIIAYYISQNFLNYLSWAVIVGGVLQVVVLIVTVNNNEIKIQYFSKIIYEHLRDFGKLFSVSFFSSGLLQINIFIGTIIASYESGAISYLYYADRIYQLPLALIGIAMGIVLLPAISFKISKNLTSEINQTIENTVKFALLLSIPSAVGLYVLPDMIVNVLFERGQFDTESTLNTAIALKYYSLGLVAFILLKIYTPIFFAYENARPALYVTFINLIMNTGISVVLFINLGFVGIVIGTSISAWFSVIIMQFYLNNLNYYKLKSSLILPMFIIFISSLILFFYLQFLKAYIDELYIDNKIIFLLFSVVSSILLYFFMISFYKPFSYRELKKIVSK